MIHGNEPKKITQVIPSARHRHSAVVFNQGMWVYGGMTDLQERGDLWRLDLSECPIRLQKKRTAAAVTIFLWIGCPFSVIKCFDILSKCPTRHANDGNGDPPLFYAEKGDCGATRGLFLFGRS